MFHVQKWTFYMLISKLHIHVNIFLLLINGKKKLNRTRQNIQRMSQNCVD